MGCVADTWAGERRLTSDFNARHALCICSLSYVIQYTHNLFWVHYVSISKIRIKTSNPIPWSSNQRDISQINSSCCSGTQHYNESSYEVWQKSNETEFLFTKFLFIFSNINVISFKIVPLGSYTSMETLFPLLVAALQVFNRYGLQHDRYTLLDVFKILELTSFEDIFKFRKNKKYRG